MARHSFGEWDKSRLRWLLGLFFIALALPTTILTWQAFSRLQWESFHQHQQLAQELITRLDRRLVELIDREEARSFTDYSFLVVEGAPAVNYLQRSPLSGFPVEGELPGLLGYFQIDAQGRFTTPLLPEDTGVSPRAYGITIPELQQRREQSDRLLRILSLEQWAVEGGSLADRALPAPVPTGRNESENMPAAEMMVAGRADDAEDRPSTTMKSQATRQAPREQKLSQSFFDRLADEGGMKKLQRAPSSIGRVDELKLDRPAAMEQVRQQASKETLRQKQRQANRGTRRERSALPELAVAAQAPPVTAQSTAPATSSQPSRVRIFESEIDPFEFSQLPSGHFVLYRKVWRDGQRYIQGALLEQAPLLRKLIEAPYRDTVLSAMSRLVIAYRGDILSAFGGAESAGYLSSTDELAGTLLYRSRLSAPFSGLEAILTITHMPTGHGASLITWTALTLGLVLSGGLLLIYRLGLKQIELYRQQRDFVSAVSHELKTPLTSIRMYSEMLREGWADEARKPDYYNFIHDESERLSRLIANVLQLARMSRNRLQLRPRSVAVRQLMDAVLDKVSSQVERTGFELVLTCNEEVNALSILVDEDAFIQIFINLVDNAVKFSAKAETRRIEIGCRRLGGGSIQFTIRDYGPGIPRGQLKKIFKLFYRSEDELTRETVGTGIGLALVHRLVSALNGTVDVLNQEPGAEFRLVFASGEDAAYS